MGKLRVGFVRVGVSLVASSKYGNQQSYQVPSRRRTRSVSEVARVHERFKVLDDHNIPRSKRRHSLGSATSLEESICCCSGDGTERSCKKDDVGCLRLSDSLLSTNLKNKFLLTASKPSQEGAYFNFGNFNTNRGETDPTPMPSPAKHTLIRVSSSLGAHLAVGSLMEVPSPPAGKA